MKQEQKRKINLTEMAKKRRHLHLVEKLSTGKPSTPSLTKAEIRELENFENQNSSGSILDSQEKVAKVFGVSVRTVQNWIHDGMPVTRDGVYDAIEIRAWRMVKKEKKQKKESSKKTNWEERYREMKARLAEIELKKVLGEVISIQRVQTEIIFYIQALKSSLLRLPMKLSPLLEGQDVRAINDILSREVKSLIEEFAQGCFDRLNIQEAGEMVKKIFDHKPCWNGEAGVVFNYKPKGSICKASEELEKCEQKQK